MQVDAVEYAGKEFVHVLFLWLVLIDWSDKLIVDGLEYALRIGNSLCRAAKMLL